MRSDKIYNRLYNDVLASIQEEVFLLNQENDINQPNTFNKKGWRHYVDGGSVKKNSQNYNASYTFDYKDPISKNKKVLSFTSYKPPAGLNLLDFINSVINAPSEIFVKVENLIIKDARKYLFEVIRIQVTDSEIDDTFLKTVKRYFKNLEEIEFRNCTIKKDCNFNIIKIPLNFSHCQIENIRSFNDCEADIKLSRCHVEKISPSTIKSNKLDIGSLSNTNYIDIKSLFLKCNFPNLTEFMITPEHTKYDNYSFEDSFTYLPDSAPNIEVLTIMGKVTSLDFLTKFKYLLKCSIQSIYDDFSLMYANVTDGKERKRILERNRKEYEIAKILQPDKEDKYIIESLEMQRILRLSHFLSLIHYTAEDKEFLNHPNLLEFLLNKEPDPNVESYYECYFDDLRLKRQKEDHHTTLFNYDEKYKIINNMLYAYYPYRNDKQIIRTEKFIYGINGLPIIFKSNRKPIRTVEDAKKKIENVTVKSFDLDESNYQQFIDELKNLKIKNSIPIGGFIDSIDEICNVKVKSEDFLKFGKDGKKMYTLFEKYNRQEKRRDDLIEKQKNIEILLAQLIADNYSLFTAPEKAYMYMHRKDYLIAKNLFIDKFFAKIYPAIVNDEAEVLTNINTKTKGLYEKYSNYIKMIYHQFYTLENPYYIEIKPEDIEPLQLQLKLK